MIAHLLLKPQTLAAVKNKLEDYAPSLEVWAEKELFLKLPPGATLEELVSLTGPLWAGPAVAANKFVARVLNLVNRGPVLLPPGREKEFLALLPVEVLWPLSPRVIKRLKLLGLKTVGEISLVPPAELYRQFGPVALLIASLSRGVDHTPVKSDAHPCRIQVKKEVALNSGPLLPQLARELSLELWAGDLGCRALSLEIATPWGNQRAELNTSRPQWQASILQGQLDKLWHKLKPPEQLETIAAVAAELKPLLPQEQELFGTRTFKAASRLEFLDQRLEQKWAKKLPADRQELYFGFCDPWRAPKEGEKRDSFNS